MRRALLTLSSAGIIASLFFSSCTIEKDKGDDEDGGGSGKVNISGGNSGLIGAGGTDSQSTGGTGAKFEQEECPGLTETLRGDSGEVCSTSKKAAQFERINMLIVLDKSGSMKDKPADYTKTKWVSAMDSLKAALKPEETLLNYGFMLYPYVQDAAATSCDLPSGDAAVNIAVAPASESVPAINGLMAATEPGGGTPTAAALTEAYNYYTTGSGASLQGTKYVLLVTDGGPNCNSGIAPCGPETCTANLDKSGNCGNGIENCCATNLTLADGTPAVSLCLDDTAVKTQLQTMLAQNIKTFVVGIPGSEAYAVYLDDFAESGGVPVQDKAHKYYEVKSETDLLAAFTEITTSLVRDCVVPLQEEPQDKSKINVAIDCNPVLKTSGDGTVNWEYDEANRQIAIKGKQCEVIETKGVKRIDVVNGCPTIIQL